MAYGPDAHADSATPPLAVQLEPRLQASEGDDDSDAAPVGDPAGDPPARVGRLNYVTNTVTLRPAGLTAYTPAQLNRPVVHGDSLWTGDDGRAELHIGSHVIRMGAHTALTVTSLNDQQMQLSVAQGSVSVRVRELGEAEIAEIDLPTAAMTLQRRGIYRADVDTAGTDVDLTVRQQGRGEILASGTAWGIESDQRVHIRGAAAITHAITPAPDPDAFDTWCSNRDRSEDHPVSLQYVSRGTVGYEDLDAHGAWSETPTYGAVWYPTTVAADWAPYRNGNWAWIEPWGWTWVDDAPWGFAPFHYGRWIYATSRWGWAPGPIWGRPCYAPALVGFVGVGAFGVGLGATVAWFPLGWHEPYVPTYRTSYGYVHQVNITQVNVTHVNNLHPAYVNQKMPGSITAVHSSVLQNGGAVGAARFPAPAAASHALVLGSAPRVVPSAQSVIGRPSLAGSTPVAQPAPQVINRATVTRVAPMPASQPFAAHQAALSQNAGRPLPPSQSQSPSPSRSSSHLPVTSGYSHATVLPPAYGGQIQGPQMIRTGQVTAPVGPHRDPHPRYSQPTSSGSVAASGTSGATYRLPASGSYNAGAAAYHPAAGAFTPRAPAQRYEPIARPAPAPSFHPIAGRGHFGGRR